MKLLFLAIIVLLALGYPIYKYPLIIKAPSDFIGPPEYNFWLTAHPNLVGDYLSGVTAFFLIFVLAYQIWVQINQKKLSARDLFFREAEIILKNLESWAQEMVWSTNLSITDYDVLNAQLSGGVDNAHVRHMYTGHGGSASRPTFGKNFRTRTSNLILVGPDRGKSNAISIKSHIQEWQQRFAKAVINYISLYEMLENNALKLDDPTEILALYKKTMYGLLYVELKNAYGIMTEEEITSNVDPKKPYPPQ